MKILLHARILKVEDIDEQVSSNPNAVALLNQAAYELVAAGWTPTLEDWTVLLPCERAAVLLARQRVLGEAAVRSAMAASGPVGMALASGDPSLRDDIAIGIGVQAAIDRAKHLQPPPKTP